ncbi:transketolase [Capronia epimyces CBS 606.96]|uniref:Transketolase n=1 Tax=Capronia epimyces CBS 606.96 TaxID=1182542 RepID=W9Y4B1_9EURO|nr:transketolase [Capronia epimyces CBS 606.96]EXJ77304.1 transketolase [Capronia epimyces CBS 606.96]
MVANTSKARHYDADDLVAVNTLRALSVDMSYAANSGHPGAPMGMAPLFHVLFSKMKLNPDTDKDWVNRDRFVLSNGHACALLYSVLHLLGYKITLDDLKAFRQLDSNTPGHPENTHTPGVEVTTGPLGQGFANAVGLAIAQAHLGATYNRAGFDLFNHKTFVVFGDGCAMEGVASEAASLAGHLRLENLIALYDDNHICIDGDTDSTFTEDVLKRFEAYGWHTEHVPDGDTNLGAIDAAIERALAVRGKPTVIKVTTTIGYGSSLQGTAACHGSPLKMDDLKQFRQKFGIPEEPFTVPSKVYKAYQEYALRGKNAESQWQESFTAYEAKYPELHQELSRRLSGGLPQGWEDKLPVYKPGDSAIASRDLSAKVLAALQASLPEMLSGSADLTSSNKTIWKGAVDFQPPGHVAVGSYQGRYLRWGDEEHAMGAAMNGLAAYGANLIPVGGTFLNFVAYAAGAVRLSALSQLRVIWIATHDSIALGEDGPTHQPIEALAHYRAMPNLHVWRPADGNECSAAYYVALKSSKTPSILALSRQGLPQLQGSSIEVASRGGYVCYGGQVGEQRDITLVSTGSEVATCIEAAAILEKSHQLKVSVVSMPCQEVFDAQPEEYRLSVLPAGAPVMSVEAASTRGWEKYSQEQFGIDEFGASAPCDALFKKFDITPSGVASRALETVFFYQGTQNLRSPLQKALQKTRP